MASTHDTLTNELELVQAARTQLANAEMELTGRPDEDFESWEGVYVAASNLLEAATSLEDTVRVRMRAAEEAWDAQSDAFTAHEGTDG